jgi:peptidoglycan-associated lipoprotein
MTTKGFKKLAVVLSFTSMTLLAGCHKQATTAKVTPPAPPPAAPTVSLSASPSAIERGQTSELTWHTENATDVNISGLGNVPGSGRRSVSPQESTTYQLMAKGPGGSGDASTRITVSVPAPAVARSSVAQVTEEELFSRNIHDVFFDYNKHDIRSNEMPLIQSDAGFLQQHSDIKVLIEGHCDERGTEEYNISLGDERATAVKDSLIRLGVPANRIDIVSYGKERPFCTDENETCWQQNRRGHFVFERTTTSAVR